MGTARWRPLPWTQVRIYGGFWGPRLEVNRRQTLPHVYRQLEETGRIDAFRLAWRPGMEPRPHYFWDSDVAKWVEAASYSLASHPDPELAAWLQGVVGRIAAAQQPDGYLNTYFTVVEPGRRWTDLRDAHELYCAGHLMEAAVAHYQGTGERVLLDALCRYADHIGRVFGTGDGQLPGYCGHEEIELALLRLYRCTGEGRYLQLARYFIDQRGQQPHYFDLEARRRGGPGHAEAFMRGLRDMYRYSQAHIPVRQQGEAVGHAVRAMYLYTAMADLAGEVGDEALQAAAERLWADVTQRHMYVTGGVGSSAANEGFTADYDLPNARAYAETCAAVGLILWAQRMLQLEGDGRYADVLERVLYNGASSGLSLDGRRFFYANPLASDGEAQRQPWFPCACCPPNIARLLSSLGQYVASVDTSGREVALHLYVQGSLKLSLAGVAATLELTTLYPWEGAVEATWRLPEPVAATLWLRIPGWCRAPTARVNGTPVDVAAAQRRGYLPLARTWRTGDRVELELPMPVERVWAHPEVRADAGAVALQRGPLVYCFEQVDNPDVPLEGVAVEGDGGLQAHFAPDVLGGMVVVSARALVAETVDWQGSLYRFQPPVRRPVTLRAVPYYAWNNRGAGAMRVWLPEARG